MATLDVLRVFVGEVGSAGNALGVFLDGRAVPADRRQSVAADLGFAETVFVDDAERGEVRIFTPSAELPFAGHPTVGTSWLLAHRGLGVSVLRPPAGEVETWQDGDLTWIRARPAWSPAMEMVELGSPAAVEAQTPPAGGFLYVWAWQDRDAGRVRARSFPVEFGIVEDEATGSAAVRLGAALDRPLRILQGVGSVLHARPGHDGTVEVGGAVVAVETRDYRI